MPTDQKINEAAAVIDLEGFTWFCSENPALIQKFAVDFTDWVLRTMKALDPEGKSVERPYF